MAQAGLVGVTLLAVSLAAVLLMFGAPTGSVAPRAPTVSPARPVHSPSPPPAPKRQSKGVHQATLSPHSLSSTGQQSSDNTERLQLERYLAGLGEENIFRVFARVVGEQAAKRGQIAVVCGEGPDWSSMGSRILSAEGEA